MNAIMYANLSSEAISLKKMLEDMPKENVIDRLGLENRLEDIEHTLNTINPYHINKSAKLTFRGNPVIGSEAIYANFASNATKLFSDAVAAFSASLKNQLKSKGPIPDSNSNQLMITGMAVGSFGFQFELPRLDHDLCPETSIVEKAIDDIRDLFLVATNGSDDDLNDIIEEIHPRAISKIHDFLFYLLEQRAKCGLEFDNKFFRFENDNDLELAISRLNEENITEENVSYIGKFLGALPHTRNFEFENEIDKEIIKGKISKDILQPDLLNTALHLKTVEVIFKVTTIGNSRPKFILESLNNIT